MRTNATNNIADARPSRRISIEPPPSAAEHRWNCQLLVFLRSNATDIGAMVERSADGGLHLFERKTGQLIAGTAANGVSMAEVWHSIESVLPKKRTRSYRDTFGDDPPF